MEVTQVLEEVTPGAWMRGSGGASVSPSQIMDRDQAPIAGSELGGSTLLNRLRKTIGLSLVVATVASAFGLGQLRYPRPPTGWWRSLVSALVWGT